MDGGGALTTDGETLSFNLTLEEMRRVGEVRLACMDEDRFTSDDLIGTVRPAHTLFASRSVRRALL